MIPSTLISLLFTTLLAASAHGQKTAINSVGGFPYLRSSSRVLCQDRKAIAATGFGHSSVRSTIAVITLVVDAKEKTAVSAEEKLAQKSTRLREYLRSQRVNKLSTSDVSLNANVDYNLTPPKISDYNGKRKLSFEVPIAKSNRIIEEAARFGAHQSGGVKYKAAAAAEEAARGLAVKDAIRMAKKEAATAVKALRRTLGKPGWVRIDDNLVKHSSTGSFGAIAGGENTVTASVSVSYRLS